MRHSLTNIGLNWTHLGFRGIGYLARVMKSMPDALSGNSALTELGERLLTESLSDSALLRATDATPDYPILPWVHVLKLGGQSLMDRGRAAVYPLVDEIVSNLRQHKMILGTGPIVRLSSAHFGIEFALARAIQRTVLVGRETIHSFASVLRVLLCGHDGVRG